MRGELLRFAEKYVASCHASDDEDGGGHARGGRLPNIAGLARLLGVGVADISALEGRHPEQYRALLALMEDEALNSDKSSTLINTYFKERLRLGTAQADESSSDAALTVVFEHDVLSDGE